MIGIIVATHGNMGIELIKTAEMVIGECQNTVAVPLFPHESCEEITLKIKQALSRVNQDDDGAVIFTDLAGGSCCNISGMLLKDEKIAVLTGVNLPMVINLINHRDEGSFDDIVAAAQKAGVKSIINLRERMKNL